MSDKETQIQQGFSKALLDCVEFERDNCNDKPATDTQAMANPKVQALVEALQHLVDLDDMSTTALMEQEGIDKARAALAALDADT